MFCNMRSKLIPTDYDYIHKYRYFLSFHISQPPHVLKKFVDCMSYTIMLNKHILSGTPKRKRCLNIGQFCIDYCKLMVD